MTCIKDFLLQFTSHLYICFYRNVSDFDMHLLLCVLSFEVGFCSFVPRSSYRGFTLPLYPSLSFRPTHSLLVLDSFHLVVFCVVTGFSPSDFNDIPQIVSTKYGFLFLFVLLYDRGRGGRIDSSGENLNGTHACLLAQLSPTYGLSLSIEPRFGKRIDASKFSRPSADFVPFRSYIQNLEKRNRSLSKQRAQEGPIADHPGPTSAFCITLPQLSSANPLCFTFYKLSLLYFLDNPDKPNFGALTSICF